MMAIPTKRTRFRKPKVVASPDVEVAADPEADIAPGELEQPDVQDPKLDDFEVESSAEEKPPERPEGPEIVAYPSQEVYPEPEPEPEPEVSAELTPDEDTETDEDRGPEPKDTEKKETNLVRVRCISDRRPWTADRYLSNGEVVEIPKEDADVLIDLGMVEKADE